MKKNIFLYHLKINLIVRINHHPLEEDEITYVILFSDQFFWLLLKHHFCEFISRTVSSIPYLLQRITISPLLILKVSIEWPRL